MIDNRRVKKLGEGSERSTKEEEKKEKRSGRKKGKKLHNESDANGNPFKEVGEECWE